MFFNIKENVMFFYHNDLYEYNIHIQDTKNISFLKMSKLLKDKGIKNNKFMLYLIDKGLNNIDPHNLADPSLELMTRILTECKQNPWYFIREMVRVPVQGMKPQPYILHRGNMALTWCFYQDIDSYLMLPRQFYKTVSTMAIAGHLMFISVHDYPMTLITKDNRLVQDNVGRLRDIKYALPEWAISKNMRDKENAGGIYYAALNNTYSTICSQNDELAADRVARGASTPFQHYDEIDFIKYIRIMYGAAVAATVTARENASKAGAPNANILTSTAGFLDADEGVFAQEIRDKCMLFYDGLYDCENSYQLNDILVKNSLNRMMLIIYSYIQLGKTQAWIDNIKATQNRSEADIRRDYYLIPVAGKGDESIPTALLATLRDTQIEPIHTDMNTDQYIQHWYVSRAFRNSQTFKDRKYILGMDSSDAIGNDWTSTCLIDSTDMSVVSTFRINEANTVKVGKYLAKILIENPNIVFIPEAKSTGRQIVDVILLEFKKHGINPYKRIYSDVVQNLGDSKYKDINIHDFSNVADSKYRKYFGFTTTGSGNTSRDRLFSDTLFRALEMNGTRIYDKTLVNEFCGLRVKNGRLDHGNGGHDDMVVAYLLTCYLIYYGKNLHIYGLDPTKVLSRVDAKGKSVTPEDKAEINNIRIRIRELEDLINKCTSPTITESYSRELRHLRSMDVLLPEVGEELEQVVMHDCQPEAVSNIERSQAFYDSLRKVSRRFFWS